MIHFPNLLFSRRGIRARQAHVNNAFGIQRGPFFRASIPEVLDIDDSDSEPYQYGEDRIPQRQYGALDRVFLSKFSTTQGKL